MRFARTTAMGISFFLLPGILSAATKIDIGDQVPESYDTVKSQIKRIDEVLGEAKCGGWDTQKSVETYIADVRGLPGRQGKWDGNILSGMGARSKIEPDEFVQNDFTYPSNATGLSTACRPGVEQIHRMVWVKTGNPDKPDEVIQVEKIFPAPYFENPVCIWRRKDNADPNRDYTMDPPRYPDLLLEKDQYDPSELEFEEMTGEDDNGVPRDRQSPVNCIDFCREVNHWLYEDCAEPVQMVNLAGIPYIGCPEPRPSTGGANMTAHHLCTGEPDDDVQGDACNIFSPSAGYPNVHQCRGEECRCPGNGCISSPPDPDLIAPQEMLGPNGHEYWSYFRIYISGYEREELKNLENAQSSETFKRDAIVACYGIYEEFDPLLKQALAKDRRCLMSIDLSMMQKTQLGRGSFGQHSSINDRDPNELPNQRRATSSRARGQFDEDTDLWYLKLAGGFSLINQKIFKEKYDENLTSVFLDTDELDGAEVKATYQLDQSPPIAEDLLTRAFDDSGEKRILTNWWHSQQQAVSEILHPSIIRLKLPAAFALGIDPEDPFFKQKGVRLDRQKKQESTIEIQIDAKEDLLGSALGYIERSMLLQLDEEPLPMVVPVGSATELRGLSEQWCLWYMRTHNSTDCSSPDARVKEIMDTAESYADHIDDARILRGELTLYASELLSIQRELTEPIKQWIGDNLQTYLDVIAKQIELQDTIVKPQWEEIKKKMDTFTYDTNLPYCMNQRFTMPIYSLLDEWVASRGQTGEAWGHRLPKIEYKAFEDTVIDFSTIAYMTGSIKIPVLKPVQVRVTDFPLPPDGPDHQIPDEWTARPLPDIAGANVQNPQDVIGIRETLKTMRENLPGVDTTQANGAPDIEQPSSLTDADIQKIDTSLKDINSMLEQMDERYEKFWKSVGPFKDNDDDPDYDPDNKAGITYKISRYQCKGWDDNACQHVEMDLLERLQRIGSRPLVFLREDFESKGEIKMAGGPCVPADHVCTPLHSERNEPRIQWDIRGPATDTSSSTGGNGASSSSVPSIDDLRQEILERSFYEPLGTIPVEDFPPYASGTKALLPIYQAPRPFDITPPTSSSSTSSIP